MRNRAERRQRTAFLAAFLLPTFLFFCMFMGYPVVNGLYLSFFDWSGGSETMNFIGLDNYRKLAHDPIAWKSIVNDYALVLGKTVGIMLLATFFAVSLARFALKGTGFYRSVFFIPNVISVVVIGVLWRYIYNPNLGFLNGFLSLVKGESVATPWLGNADTALWAILAPSIWAGIGFYMLLLIAAILTVPESIYESARLDGATQWEQFWQVTLPLVWEQAKVSVLHIVMTTLNGSFIIVLVMTEGGPDNATQVMGSYLYQMGFRQFHLSYAATIGVLILALSLLTTALLHRIMRKDTQELA